MLNEQTLINNKQKLDDLLKTKKIIFISGKGGVGKSQISALLALQARELGLKPLIFECDSPQREVLLEGALEINSEVREIVKGIHAVNQKSEEAVVAYARAALPSKWLAEILFQNKVASLFLNASPSVKEMALLGQIVELSESDSEYYPILVDLHSSGHALALLSAPEGIMKVLRSGPIYDRAKHVFDVIHNSELSTLIPVSLAEELPVEEIGEFVVECMRRNIPIDLVILNSVFQMDIDNKSRSFLSALLSMDTAQKAESNTLFTMMAPLRFVESWSTEQREQHEKLQKFLDELSIPILGLPHILEVKQKKLAHVLFAALNSREAEDHVS